MPAARPDPTPTGEPKVVRLPGPFESFYLQEYRRVVKLAYALSGSRVAAEDIAQEAFLAAYRDWDRVGGYEQRAAWVRQVAANLAMSSLRRRFAEVRAWPGWLAAARSAWMPCPPTPPTSGGRCEHCPSARPRRWPCTIWRICRCSRSPRCWTAPRAPSRRTWPRAGGRWAAAAMALLAAVAVVAWTGGRWMEGDRTVTGPTPAPALQVTASIGVGGDLADVLVSDGAVWVASSGEGTVLRIDPATNQVTGRFGVGANPVRLAAGHGSVWVANSDASVSRIDPASGGVVTIPVTGIRPSDLAVTDDAVWVISGSGVRLVRIDPDTNRQVAVPEGLPSAPLGVAVVDRRLWVSTGPGVDRTGEVTVGDARTDRVAERLQAPGDGQLAVGAGSVWRAGVTTQAVYRLDPASGRQLAAVPLGVVPVA